MELLQVRVLHVLHDLTIGSNSVLDLNTNSIALTVGHNFTLSSGGTLTPGTLLTTTFNGTGSQTFSNSGTITGNLRNLTLANTADLTLNGTNTTLTIPGNLTIGDGTTLRDNGKTIYVQGNIVNSGTHFTGSGSIELTGTAAQTISGDGTGILNSLTLNKTGGSVTVTANMTVKGNLRLAGTAGVWNILNIGSYNLLFGANAKVYSDMTTGTTFDNNRMIQTGGAVSDGGVSKTYSSSNLSFNFPIGFYTTAYYYMPHSISLTSATTYGSITTRPVNGRHPLTENTNSLSCYWKTTSTGFTGIPSDSVTNIYYYDYAASNDFVGTGTETSYIPAVCLDNSIWSQAASGVVAGSNQVTYYADNADGEYTAGETNSFGTVQVRYSAASGDWENASTWSADSVGGPSGASAPTSSTVVIIGNATYPHTVTVTSNTRQSANLTIAAGSTLNLQHYTGHNFGSISTSSGTLRIASSNFPGGDWGNFIGSSGGTVEYYTTATSGSITVPTTSETALALSTYRKLKFTHSDTYSIILPDRDLTIYDDLTVTGSGSGSVSTRTSGTSRTYTINDSLNIESGVLEFGNGVISTIKVLGDATVADGASFRAASTGTVVNNVLELYGDLNCRTSGTFDMDNTGRAYTYFKGTADAEISGGTLGFYNIFVDKGTSTTPILWVTANTINTGVSPFLTLSNGTLRINSSSLNIPISTTAAFTIPSTACMSVQNGTVSIGSTNDNGDLLLQGKLEVLGGTVNIGTGGNYNNDIEYAAAGTPQIVVQGGQLNVNGQIRRKHINIKWLIELYSN